MNRCPGRRLPALAISLALIFGSPEAATSDRPPGATAQAGKLDIRFDLSVIDRFLEFLERGKASERELDGWVGLQGNRELLRTGRLEGGLSRQTLKQAVRVTIGGHPFPGAGSLGRIDVGPWEILREMVEAIRRREESLTRTAADILSRYLPPDRVVPPLRVFFHLGGSWDGRASDQVYINLTFFHARGMAALPGLEALLIHELFHRAQAGIFGSIDDYSSRQSALYTILQRIQREGTARHLEYLFLVGELSASARDRTNFRKYRDALRHPEEHASGLDEILVLLLEGERHEARSRANHALSLGGPFYALGHSMAREIESARGPAGIVETVRDGPVSFFEIYRAVTSSRPGRPVLPAEIWRAIDSLKAGYARAPLAATTLRRNGLRALFNMDIDAAIEALNEAVSLDPSDAIAAYNLACAHAIETRRRERLVGESAGLERYAATAIREKALRWLDEALRRGFDDHKQVRIDPDLTALQGDTDFDEILAKHGIVPAGRPVSP